MHTTAPTTAFQISVNGGAPITWAEFLGLNDFELPEALAIEGALRDRGEYQGGGGAEAEFTLRVVSTADLPDIIWATDAKGNRLPWGRPNFDKPGVAEAVERAAFYGECAANPHGGGLSSIVRMAQINRFEEGRAR